MRGIVVHSIREATPEGLARRLTEAPAGCGMIEIRADDLRASDVSALVRRHPVASIVTVRTLADGGGFDGSTEEKRWILTSALRSGCAFVDVEWDGPLRELSWGSDAARTILSHHGSPCDAGALRALHREMAGTQAARLKIVPAAGRLRNVLVVRDLLREARDRGRMCAFASSSHGVVSRILAIRWGSWGTYGSAASGRETGDGQLTSHDLLETYRAHEISETTRGYALFGAPIRRSPSPAVHAAAYRSTGLDAIYLPLETDDLSEASDLADPAGMDLAGFGVTTPLKEAAARRCVRLDEPSSCGAVNTVVCGSSGWEGFNTDAPAALMLIRRHVEPAECEVAVVGAGGTAKAIAAALRRAGSVVTMFNRNPERGSRTAADIGIRFSPLSDLLQARWDILVQATPLGSHGEELLPRRALDGRLVLDAAYGTEPTPLVRTARARGLAVVDGFALLHEQAALQFTRLTGEPAPREAMADALARFSSGTWDPGADPRP